MVNVAGRDVFLGPVDGLDEVGLVERSLPVAELVIYDWGGSYELFRERACFPPFTGAVMVDEEFGINAKSVLSVIVDPATGCSCWKAEVAALGVPLGEGLIEISVVGDVSLEDFDGAGSDDGKRRGVIGGKVADGVEEDQTGKVGKLPDEVFRLAFEWREPGSKSRRVADHRGRNSGALRECKVQFIGKALPLTCSVRLFRIGDR